ncbi:SLATT domain-containing protein [Thermodesulfobacteriota bacterium]
MTEPSYQLLDIWYNDLYMIGHAHYEAATHYSRRNMQLGVPVAILSAAVGTTVFASVGSNPATWAKIIVGVVSFTAAVLASLHTHLKYQERAEKHRIAGARFIALLKEVEINLNIPLEDENELRLWCIDLKRKWDKLSEDSPTVPPKIFARHRSKHKYSKLGGQGNQKDG